MLYFLNLDPFPIFVVSIQHFIFNSLNLMTTYEGLYINSTITLTRISVR